MEEKALRKREQKLSKRSNEKLHGLGELNGSHELCGLKRTLISQRREQGITLIALVVTMVLHYDKVKKCSNSNSFLLSSI